MHSDIDGSYHLANVVIVFGARVQKKSMVRHMYMYDGTNEPIGGDRGMFISSNVVSAGHMRHHM